MAHPGDQISALLQNPPALFPDREDFFHITVRNRMENDIKFFQVSREKGAIGGEECGEYFPPIDLAFNGTHDLTRDEDFYVIEPPFTPIFTGEF